MKINNPTLPNGKIAILSKDEYYRVIKRLHALGYKWASGRLLLDTVPLKAPMWIIVKSQGKKIKYAKYGQDVTRFATCSL